MNRKDALCGALKQVAFGYVMLYFNINIGTVDLLPAWFGYVLFHKAITGELNKEDPMIGLLRPLAVVLGVYSFIAWLFMFGGESLYLPIVSVLESVIELYFHFQLLTNLANIAAKYHCKQEKNILTLRTVQTVLQTVYVFLYHIEQYELSFIIGMVQLIVLIWLCVVLFGLKKSMEQVPDEIIIQGSECD